MHMQVDLRDVGWGWTVAQERAVLSKRIKVTDEGVMAEVYLGVTVTSCTC